MDSPVAATARPPVTVSAVPTVAGLAFPAPPDTSLIQVTTLVLWFGCLSIGGLGLVWRYPRPAAPVTVPAPLVAEVLHVELTNDPLPPPEDTPAGSVPPPPLLAMPSAPAAPSLTAVAEPSESVAFALPVEGPTRSAVISDTDHSRPVAASKAVVPAAGPAVQALTYGQGEGKQPAPRYPVRARNAGQEGTVVVRFSVGPDGRVLDATAATPSPWPLLNAEAVRTVREFWRFRPGAARLCEVAIHFSLTK